MADLNTSITNNSLLTEAVGQAITDVDKQINSDWANLHPDTFMEVYGEDVFNAKLAEQRAVEQLQGDILLSQSRTEAEALADTTKNIIGGALTGMGDVASLGANVLGMEGLSKGIAKVTHKGREFFDDLGSDAEKAQGRVYSREIEGLNNRLDREYNEAIASGKSEFEAKMERVAKEASGTIDSLFESGQYSKVVSQGLGSFGTDVLLTGGISAVAKGAAKVGAKFAPELMAKVASSSAYNSRVANKLKEAAPWMASTGMQEGGSVFTDQLIQGLETPIEDLKANSPLFEQRVQELLASGEAKNRTEAEEMAREDLAFDAAEAAAIRTGVAATALGYMTRGMAKPFERGDKSLTKFIGEALTEVPEESLSEGAGTLAQNLATRDYLDRNQELTDSLGQALAEGGVGGLGMTGVRAPGVIVKDAIPLAKKSIDYALGKAKEYKEKRNEAYQATSQGMHENIDAIKEVSPTVGNDLDSIAQKIEEQKFIDPEKDTDNEFNPQESLENLNAINSVENNFNTTEQEEPTSKRFSNTTSALKEKALEPLKNRANLAINNVKASNEVTEQDTQAVANAIAGYSIAFPERASNLVSQLPEPLKASLKSTKFADARVQSAVNKAFGNEPVEEKKPTRGVPKAQPKSSAPRFTPVSQEEAKQLNFGISVPLGGNQTLKVANNGLTFIEHEGKLLKLNNKETSSFLNGFTKLSQENKHTPENIAQLARDLLVTAPQAEEFDVDGKKIQVNFDHMIIDGQAYELSLDAQNTLYNPESTQEQKLEALKNEFEDDANTDEEETIRKAQSLDPEVLAKENKYVEQDDNGNYIVGEYDSETVKQAFSNKFGETLAKLFTPVKRVTHVWNSNSSLQTVIDLVKDPDNLSKYLRANNFSNASRLEKVLYKNHGKSNYSASIVNSVILKGTSLAERVTAALNPEGVFQQKISKNLKALQKSHGTGGEKLEGILYNSDGSIKPEMLDIIRLAAPHFVSQVGTYIHNLTDDELLKVGIDPELQGDSFVTLQGLPSQMALQNLATSFRKLMGVAINNDASLKEVEEVTGQLASRTTEMLVDAGILEVVDIPYTDYVYNKETGKKDPVEKSLKGFLPTEDFKGIFKPKADILEALLSPKFKNQIHFTPVDSVNNSLAHSNIHASNAQVKVIEKENSKAVSFNTPFINLLDQIGGEEGLTNLLYSPIDSAREHLYTVKHLASERGRALSRSLGFDFLNEVRLTATKPLKDTKVYFENIALRNGRIMQVGAATYQNNKLLRQILNYLPESPVDLTNKKIDQCWRSTLAQKLGVSVNNLAYSKYEGLINNALSFIKESTDNGKYSKVLQSLLDETVGEISADQAENTVNTLKDFIKAFNTKFDGKLTIKDEESLNALVEAIRYNNTSEADKKNYIPRIFLEVDGISDGPSNINSMYGIAIGPFSAEFLVNKFRTGLAPGLKTSSQELNDPESEVSKLTGSNGKNLHKEVAEEKIPQKVFERLVEANKRLLKKTKSSAETEEAERIQNTLINYMTLFKAIGWLEKDDINALRIMTKVPANSEDYPVTFKKDISKKLTTIIPYGSQTKGSSLQVIKLLIEGLNKQFSDALFSVAENGYPASQVRFNGVAYSDVHQALKGLFKVGVRNDGTFTDVFITEEQLATLMRGLPEKFPTKHEINNADLKAIARERAKADREKKPFITNEIREFSVSSLGYEFLVTNLMPVFGEPAQIAVNDALGSRAMKGARFVMEIGGLLSLIAKNYQALLLHQKQDKLDSLTQNELYKLEKEIQRVSPIISFRGGVKVFAEKTKTYADSEPVYKSSSGDGAFDFYSSRLALDSASLSLGALATQGIGDGTVMYYLSELFNGNFGNVFDGHYGAPSEELSQLGESANKAVQQAQLQKPFRDLERQLSKIGKHLIDITGASSAENALAIALSRIAQNRFIDGAPITDLESKTANQYEVNSFLKLTEEDNPFVADLQSRNIENNRTPNHIQYSEENIDALTQDRVKTLLRNLDLVRVNEEIHHHVFDRFPQTFHHMSALDDTYTYGDVKEAQVWKDALTVINSTVDGKFENIAELQAAYFNTKAEDQFLTVFPGEFKLKAAWRNFIGANKGNSGYRTLQPAQERYIDRVMGIGKGLEQPKQINLNKVVKTYPTSNILRKALNSLKNRSEHPAIFNNIFAKLNALMPKEVNIEIHSSVETLPSDIKPKFTNRAQRGIYVVKEGKPSIYIIGHRGTLNIDNEKNLETLAHEAIHFVMSSAIHAYFNNPEKLTATQKQAFENLESLLRNFKNLKWDPDEGKPTVISRLEAILNDEHLSQEERLDESLAYIMSNGEVFQALSKAKMSAYMNRKHRGNLRSLLSNLLDAAKHLWKKILGVISGSPMDKALDFSEKGIKSYTDSLNYLGLYGANTLVILEEEFKARKLDPDRRKNLNSDLSRRAFKLDETRSIEPSSTLRGYLRNKLVTDIYFRERAKGIVHYFKNVAKATDKEVNKKVAEELQNYSNYEGDLESFVSSYLFPKEASKFAKNALRYQLPQTFSPKQRQDLTRIYTSFREQLKDDFLIDNPTVALQEDYDRSRALYNLIMGDSAGLQENVFDNRPETLVNNFEKQAIFLSLVHSVPEIQKAVDKVLINTAKKNTKYGWDPVRVLEDFVTQFNKEQTAKNFNETEVDTILKHMEYVSAEADRSAYDKSTSTKESLMDKVDQAFITGVSKTIGFVSSRVEKSLNEPGNIAKESPQEVNHIISEGARSLNNTFLKNPIANAIARDILYTRTASTSETESMLKRIKGYWDKIRKAKLEQIPEQLTKAFKHHKIDRKMLKFFDRTLGQTDISCLEDKVIQECLLSSEKLQDYIHELEEQLGVTASDYKDQYIRKAKQLANYLSGDRKSGHNLLTNAKAISQLLNEENLSKQSPKLVRIIDQLTTLYCLENLSEGDKKLFSSLFKSDSDGMFQIINNLRDTLQKEEERVGDLYQYSRLKGWRPNGNQPSGTYFIVPKRLVKQFESNGYKVIGDYKASDIDTSEPMVRMYNNYPHEKELQEGIFQSINQTAFGYQISNKTRGEANGTRIVSNKSANQIYDKFKNEKSDSGVIPLFDDEGGLIGYERAIPPEDRHLLEKDRDLFSAIAQYQVRQEREMVSAGINEDAIRLAKQHWDEATPEERKKQFIDVLHANDPAIQEAVRRLDSRTLSAIKKEFGNHLYLRRDEVTSFIGYYRMSALDMWDNTFMLPKPLENAIVSILEGIFGNNAKHYIATAEAFIKGGVSFVRDTIINRSLTIPVINATANAVMLFTTFGIPPMKLAKMYKEAFLDAKELDKRMHRAIKLMHLANSEKDPVKKKKLLKEYENNRLLITSSPIYSLVEQGEYSTITNEGVSYEEVDIAKQKFDDLVNNALDKISAGSPIKSIVSEILMLKGSKTYDLTVQMTNYGDWLAKIVGYRYLTENENRWGRKLNEQEAVNAISSLFIDYDHPIGRERDYLNRMGITWFTTYKYRITRAAIMGMIYNPSMNIVASIFSSITGLGTPLTDNMITKIATGDIWASTGWDMLLNGLALHPMAIILGLGR